MHYCTLSGVKHEKHERLDGAQEGNSLLTGQDSWRPTRSTILSVVCGETSHLFLIVKTFPTPLS